MRIVNFRSLFSVLPQEQTLYYRMKQKKVALLPSRITKCWRSERQKTRGTRSGGEKEKEKKKNKKEREERGGAETTKRRKRKVGWCGGRGKIVPIVSDAILSFLFGVLLLLARGRCRGKEQGDRVGGVGCMVERRTSPLGIFQMTKTRATLGDRAGSVGRARVVGR